MGILLQEESGQRREEQLEAGLGRLICVLSDISMSWLPPSPINMREKCSAGPVLCGWVDVP